MDSDNESICIPSPEVLEAANNAAINIIPQKSKLTYDFAYQRFMDYLQKNKIETISESVLLEYFTHMSDYMKSSSLFSQYSMLKATLSNKNNVYIGNYLKLRAFLKHKSIGYQAKTSRILTKEQIDRFLRDAPDEVYLTTKVALILGLAGACRSCELVYLKIDNVKDLGSLLYVKIFDKKMSKDLSFVVTDEEHLKYYRKYMAARPIHSKETRLFLKYYNGKMCNQVVGKGQFGRMPQEIAKYLKLPNPKEYTGHCFRRTSLNLVMNSGRMRRHGGRFQFPSLMKDGSDSIMSQIFNSKDNDSADRAWDNSTSVAKESTAQEITYVDSSQDQDHNYLRTTKIEITNSTNTEFMASNLINIKVEDETNESNDSHTNDETSSSVGLNPILLFPPFSESTQAEMKGTKRSNNENISDNKKKKENGLESRNCEEEKNDEFVCFGKTIAIQLRKLPEDVALEAMEFMQSYLFKKRLEICRKKNS